MSSISEVPIHAGPLNEYLDGIVRESKKAQEDYANRAGWGNLVKFARGAQWEKALPTYRIQFQANLTQVSLRRLTALMTDTKPTFEVHSRAPELADIAKNILTPTIKANWDEGSYDQKLSTIIPIAATIGSCGARVVFDPTIGPFGDIDTVITDPRSIILDPSVRSSSDLDRALYSGYQEEVSASRLKYLYPDDYHRIKYDTSSSSEYVDGDGASGVSGISGPVRFPGHRSLMATLRGRTGTDRFVPRVSVQHFFIQDDRLVGDLPVEFQEICIQMGKTVDDKVWPHGRRITRAGTNNIVVADGPNPYIDGKSPLVLFDWGLETEHPWGSSEVALIQPLQAILNKLGSAITENAIKMNNNIWIGDRDALEKDEWKKLNDAPGLIVKLKPNRVLRRESAPALPGSVFQMIQWLVNMIDTLTGLVDVTQGRRPVGVVSGHAMEALNLSAQTTIRLQTRKLEEFIERMGQRMVARIFQYYTSDRLMHILGYGNKWEEFRFQRDKLIGNTFTIPDGAGGMKEEKFSPARPDFARYLGLMQFRVTQGSSMAITRLQKGQLALALGSQAYLPREEVLRALEWDDPEGTTKKALAEMAMLGMGAGRGKSK